jgi:hypothetical protein
MKVPALVYVYALRRGMTLVAEPRKIISQYFPRSLTEFAVYQQMSIVFTDSGLIAFIGMYMFVQYVNVFFRLRRR